MLSFKAIHPGLSNQSRPPAHYSLLKSCWMALVIRMFKGDHGEEQSFHVSIPAVFHD